MLGFLILVFGLVHPVRLADRDWLIAWLLQVGGFFVLSYAFYRWSIPRAKSWGNMVKSAFDLYRQDLLKQLGYQQNPQQKEDERTLWDLISKQMLFGDRRGAPRVDYTDAAPVSPVQQDEPAVPLEIRRAVKPAAGSSALVVVVHIQIADQAQQVAKNIVITETVPAGFDYVWGSASINGTTVEPLGSNPYTFRVNSLRPAHQILLRYCILARPVPTGKP